MQMHAGNRGSGDRTAAHSRRRFLALGAPLLAGLLWPRGAGAGAWLESAAAGPRPGRAGVHPQPRPGITGARVLTRAQLQDAPHLARLFDQIREIPHIADGLGCYCGCADVEGYRSLLSCYEAPGMSQYCEICQGQGRLAYNRWKEGQTLEQIRRATDARYGHGDPRAPAGAHTDAGAHCGTPAT